VTLLLVALLIGFAKAGGQVLQQTIVNGLENARLLRPTDLLEPVGYTLAHGFQDFVLSIGLATPCAAAVWISLPLVTRVIDEEPLTGGSSFAARARRYAVAVLLACGLPLVVSNLLVLAVARSAGSSCALRLDNAALAGIWVALVVGTGSILAMAAAGIHQVTEVLPLRRKLASNNAVPEIRAAPSALVLTIALAVAGLSMTYVTREWLETRFHHRVPSSCFIPEQIVEKFQ
jgi:hypothetical protein